MQGFTLASLATLLLVTSAFAETRSTDARRVGDPIIIEGFSSGADSSRDQTIVPDDASADRSEGAFRYDGSAWNYWLGDAQKCWGKRRYPRCS